MPTTCSDIIRDAHEELGTLGAAQAPEGRKAETGMRRLQNLILSLPGLTLNGRWREKATSDAYTAKEGRRITVTAPGVVTLPDVVTPLGGCSRPPLDFARVQIVGEADNAGLWVYVASHNAWRQVDGLAIADDFPFGPEDEAGMAAMLAVDLSALYPNMVQPRTLARAEQAVRTFRARFKKAEPTDWSRPGDYDHVGCRDYC